MVLLGHFLWITTFTHGYHCFIPPWDVEVDIVNFGFIVDENNCSVVLSVLLWLEIS